MNYVDLRFQKNDFDIAKLDVSTPVSILGGKENALWLVRRFGGLGITTRASGADYWHSLLLSGNNRHLHGSLIIACNDVAIEFGH